MRTILALAVLGAFCAPAAASGKCVIVFASDIGKYSARLKEHEIGHCNGWVHADVKKLTNNADSILRPPAAYRRPYRGVLDQRPLAEAAARAMCEKVTGIPSAGCQWFE